MNTESINRQDPSGNKRTAAAFSLVEVTMALGLMAFCLVAMLGMLPMGLKQARESSDQVTAMQVLAAVRSDFLNVATNGETVQYEIPTGVAGKGSFFVDHALKRTTQQADAEYNVVYEVATPNGGQAPLMHLFVARVRPGALVQGNVLVEGIAQQRLN